MASDEPENLRKIIAGGLNRETSDEKFREYFSQFGSITDGAVVRDLETLSTIIPSGFTIHGNNLAIIFE